MKTILFFIKKSLAKFIFAGLLSFFGGLCGTYAIKQLSDAVNSGLADPKEFIIHFGIAILLFAILSVIATKFLAVIIQTSIFELKKEVSRKIIQADFEKIENKKKEILNVLTYDTTMISNIIDKIPDQLISLSFSSGILIYLLILSPQLTALIALVFLSSFVIIMITNKKLRYYADNYRMAWDKCFSKLNDLVFGLRELNLNSDHKNYFVETELPEALKNELYFKIKERVNIQVSNKLAESLMISGLAVIVLIIYYSKIVTFEFFGEFLILSMFMLSPLAGLASFMKNLRPLEASLKHIDSLGIMLTENKNQSKPLENTKTTNHPLVSLKEVTYCHTSDEKDFSFTLGPISLDIHQNETLFITGGNGSGKTTLCKLVTGLYSPASGEVKLTGHTINAENVMNLRDQFSAIYADNYIFDDINYIQDLSQADELLERYNLSRRVKQQEGIYSEINLSTGQLKRLAMVTALLEDKEIYFFDEWAAHQDITFRDIFYKELLPQLKKAGKTIVVISHDEQYFEYADRVVKLVEGKST